jgi:pimeloyl-ACP methyl ester carboxylesterase
MRKTTIFLHGLDSSGKGSKGQYFARYFPQMLRPNFSGTLEERLVQLDRHCAGLDNLWLIGSSFGGLMATCRAMARPEGINRLILLAPALNFAGFSPPALRLSIPTLLVIGERDTVTPPNLVIPLAKATFADLELRLVKDDHLLRASFPALEWQRLLA